MNFMPFLRKLTPVAIVLWGFNIAAPPAPLRAETSEADRIYCERERLGYWFYCVKPKPKPKPEVGPTVAVPPLPSATEQLEGITNELRELRAKALIAPTPANVSAYIRFQRAQLDRASLFSDVWQRAIWQDSDLDYTLERPVGALAKQQWLDTRTHSRDRVMASLSQRYGLFYFFASSCGACEVMAPIVKSVSARWHLTVRAISTDGGPSRHFAQYTVETGQRRKMGLQPKVTPAVVLWDAQKRLAIPIGYGVLSADELQDRIFLLTTKEAGRDY